MWNPFSKPKPRLHYGMPAPATPHDLADPASHAMHQQHGHDPAMMPSANDAQAHPAKQPAEPEVAGQIPGSMDGRIAETEMMGNIVIATLTVTDLSQDLGAEKLAELLLELAETGAAHFVLDVQSVQYMDTACLGCMVEALNRLAVNGGQIALVNPNQSVDYVFKLTRLDRVFRLCHDVPSALDAVQRTRDAG